MNVDDLPSVSSWMKKNVGAAPPLYEGDTGSLALKLEVILLPTLAFLPFALDARKREDVSVS